MHDVIVGATVVTGKWAESSVIVWLQVDQQI